MAFRDSNVTVHRRDFLKSSTLGLVGLSLPGYLCPGSARAVTPPQEPVEIGTTPQFFIDDYLVDNRWAFHYGRGSKEMILRVFHPPKKHPKNPLFAPKRREPANPPHQGGPSWFHVLRDEETGRFRMWYQDNIRLDAQPTEGKRHSDTAISYAESKDGLNWVFPKLGLFDWPGCMGNNVVWRSLRTGPMAGSPQIVTQVPEEARRGHRYLMLYLAGGMHLVGSKDGIHWDKASDTEIHRMPSDHPNNVLYDPVRKEYVMYCRSKHIYRVTGNRGHTRDLGESRQIARMTSKELWSGWTNQPQNILIADELDNVNAFNFFMGMMVYRYAGIYWGFLHSFKWNTDFYAQLAFSRDGIDFQRLLTRPALIPQGPEGAWDSGMVLTANQWVEVGDEWWLYYNGWDGPHGSQEQLERGGKGRLGAIGLTTVRKEGFISMRGPKNGGVICTRRLQWPGGKLFVNADAHEGELRVRVSDELRKPLPGFDYDDCNTFQGDRVAHAVTWKDKSLDALKGREIRLEFFLRDADLYTFRAGGSE